jgi:hypothetical protein
VDLTGEHKCFSHQFVASILGFKDCPGESETHAGTFPGSIAGLAV